MGQVDVERGVILGLASHRDSPGQRFRIHAWAPHLEAVGFRYVEKPFATPSLQHLLPQRGHAIEKAWHSLVSTATYPVRSPRPSAVDVLFVYREAMPMGPPVMETVMRRKARSMVYDIDDPIFLPPEGSTPWTRRFRDASKWRTLCGLADLTICINELIAEVVRPHARRVEVVPNAIDVGAYVGVRPERDVPVLGYSGSHTTTYLMRSIEAPLRRLARETPVEIHVVGGPALVDVPGARLREVPWSAATERDVLLGFDIGLAPATDTPWNRYKSFVKVLLYMASGLPVVASPVGLPARMIRNGDNGFLAATDDEWVDRLRSLVDDRGLRERLGAAAQATIAQEFATEPQLSRIQSLFVDVASARQRRG